MPGRVSQEAGELDRSPSISEAGPPHLSAPRSTAATTKGRGKVLLRAHPRGLGREHTLPWYTSGGKDSFLGAIIARLAALNATNNHITIEQLMIKSVS